MSDRILVVDDDADIRELVAGYLTKQGLHVTPVADGEQMQEALRQQTYDLIVLDLMLPGDDGIVLSRKLRESGQPQAPVPILMLSARNDELDRIIGLEVGADDYLTKPFAPRELLARIRAVLRRTRMQQPLPGIPRAAAPPRYIAFGDWRLDNIERCLVARDGTMSRLAGAEYSLLVYFLEQPGRVITRDQLMNRLIGSDRSYMDRSVDLRVSRLRRLLGDTATESVYIKTVRNEGYVFAKAVEHLQ